MATNLFERAVEISKELPVNKKSSVDPTIQIDGLEGFCAIDTVIKSLKTELDTRRAPIDDQLIEYFANAGTHIGRRPDNFKGREGDTVASCQLRKRSSASALSEVEIQLLDEHKIPHDISVITTEAFIFNPEHQDWVNANAAKISTALTKLGAPDGLILKQSGAIKRIVTEESINVLFTKPKDTVRQLLKVVGTTAIRKTSESSLSTALQMVVSLFKLDKKGKK